MNDNKFSREHFSLQAAEDKVMNLRRELNKADKESQQGKISVDEFLKIHKQLGMAEESLGILIIACLKDVVKQNLGTMYDLASRLYSTGEATIEGKTVKLNENPDVEIF